jgi:hypothetical protein
VPRRARRPSSRQAYAGRDRGDVGLAHALRPEHEQPFARGRRVGDERGDIDAVTGRRERTEALDALFEEDRRAVVIALAPVMETDADLEDAVVELAVGRPCGPPQELERLVLLEELAAVELRDALGQLRRRRIVAARAERLVDGPTRDSLGRARGLAVAATRCRARIRGSCGTGARPR